MVLTVEKDDKTEVASPTKADLVAHWMPSSSKGEVESPTKADLTASVGNILGAKAAWETQTNICMYENETQEHIHMVTSILFKT